MENEYDAKVRRDRMVLHVLHLHYTNICEKMWIIRVIVVQLHEINQDTCNSRVTKQTNFDLTKKL